MFTFLEIVHKIVLSISPIALFTNILYIFFFEIILKKIVINTIVRLLPITGI